jgi:hypothetical protein
MKQRAVPPGQLAPDKGSDHPCRTALGCFPGSADGKFTDVVKHLPNRQQTITRGGGSGHADPDGPATKSTVTADGADTLYDLPKASIVVLRGNLGSQ